MTGENSFNLTEIMKLEKYSGWIKFGAGNIEKSNRVPSSQNENKALS